MPHNVWRGYTYYALNYLAHTLFSVPFCHRISHFISRGVFVAFAGGFILIGLYSQPWFMDFTIAGQNMRTLFDIHTINLSVAVWVGFIALFGIATDDGVLMGTYIHQVFEEENPQTKQEIIETVVKAGLKRIRPAAMTTVFYLNSSLPSAIFYGVKEQTLWCLWPFLLLEEC